MKKIILTIVATGLFLINSHPTEAITIYQMQPKISLSLLATNTPTPTIKIGIIRPISLIPLITSTPTVAPTTAPTLTPTVEPSPTPTPAPATTVTSAPVATAAEVSPTVTVEDAETQDAVVDDNNSQIFLIATAILLGLIVVVQAWPKIKSWMHRKTE